MKKSASFQSKKGRRREGAPRARPPHCPGPAERGRGCERAATTRPNHSPGPADTHLNCCFIHGKLITWMVLGDRDYTGWEPGAPVRKVDTSATLYLIVARELAFPAPYGVSCPHLQIQRAQQLSPRFSRTRVVVQPALRDAMHQNVFPQVS